MVLSETPWPTAFFGYPDVKLLGMWSWHAKAPQIVVCGISNFTFLRSIGMAAIRFSALVGGLSARPVPLQQEPCGH
jgi:hypothetical protein